MSEATIYFLALAAVGGIICRCWIARPQPCLKQKRKTEQSATMTDVFRLMSLELSWQTADFLSDSLTAIARCWHFVMRPLIDTWAKYRVAATAAMLRGEYVDAERLWLRSVEEAYFQQDLARIESSYLGLFSLYLRQNDYRRAIFVGTKLLGMYERDAGKEPTIIALMARSLGQLYQRLGEYKAARANYNSALYILEKRLSPDDPELARLINDYNDVVKALNMNQAGALRRLGTAWASGSFLDQETKNEPDQISAPAMRLPLPSIR